LGFSLVAGAAIIGVSIMISLEILTGSLLPAIENFNDAYDDMVDRSLDKVQTNINITSHTTPGAAPGEYTLTLTVKNTGSVTLNTSDFTILINGTSYTFTYSDFYLYPEKSANFMVGNLQADGYTKVAKVIAPNGISDYYQYTAPSA
jgi:archaellum component FlaF (FlaF/FlaG flagellin family)